MPVTLMDAASLGVTGYESPAELEAMPDLRARVEAIRLRAGQLMELGDVCHRHPRGHPARRRRIARRGHPHQDGSAQARDPADILPVRLGAGRQPYRTLQ